MLFVLLRKVAFGTLFIISQLNFQLCFSSEDPASSPKRKQSPLPQNRKEHFCLLFVCISGTTVIYSITCYTEPFHCATRQKRDEVSQLATGESAFSSIKVSSSSIKGFTCDWMLFSLAPPFLPLASVSVLQSNCKQFPRYRLSSPESSAHPFSSPLNHDAFHLSHLGIPQLPNKDI